MPGVGSHAVVSQYRYIPVVYNPSVYQHGSSSSSTPAPKFLIYSFIGFFALVSFFVLWCVCCFKSHRNQCRHNTTTTTATTSTLTTTSTTTTTTNNNNNNVKRAVLPVFVYSEMAMEKLECAVCLAEFKDGEKGRILTQCNHRFHMSCIDKWLNSHSTCPLCRANPASISSELPV